MRGTVVTPLLRGGFPHLAHRKVQSCVNRGSRPCFSDLTTCIKFSDTLRRTFQAGCNDEYFLKFFHSAQDNPARNPGLIIPTFRNGCLTQRPRSRRRLQSLTVSRATGRFAGLRRVGGGRCGARTRRAERQDGPRCRCAPTRLRGGRDVRAVEWVAALEPEEKAWIAAAAGESRYAGLGEAQVAAVPAHHKKQKSPLQAERAFEG